MTWVTSLWAAVAVLGFAMVFAVPRSTLPGIMALAVAAHLLRSFCLQEGASLPLASFVAAIAVGFTAAVIAPRKGQATPIYAFAPIIPLFPGKYAIAALESLVTWITTDAAGADAEARFTSAAASGFTAAAITLALCLGAISPTLLLPRARRGHV